MAKKSKGFARVDVRFPTMPQAIAKLGVDENGDVQLKLTQEVYKNLPDYMPKKSGKLIAGMRIKSPTRIHVDGPYARFLFFGKTRTGAQVQYSCDRNPNAGPNWDRRMVADRGKAITAKMQRYVNRNKRRRKLT